MDLLRDTPFEVAFVVTPLAPPRPTLTVVVKATLTLPHDGVCGLADPQAPVSGDVHDDDDPSKPLRVEGDLAPVKPCGECFVLGRCHPRGGAATHAAVAFSVGAVRKRIAVFGDRRWGAWPMRAPSEPERFTSMPLAWERAAGGPDDPRNPIGRGAHDDPPNLEDPDALSTGPDARTPPVGCGPVARTWQARARLAGTFDDAWQRDRWPFLPADHDVAYHLASPPDQRVAGYWRGDEEITLRGLSPEHEMQRARLPSLRARVFALRAPDADPEPVAVRLDTVTVDAEARRVVLVWRGHLDVASERLEDLHALLVWHEPLDANGGVAEARARLDAHRAKLATEDAALAPEPVPSIDEPPPEAEEAPMEPELAKALDEARAALDALPPAEPVSDEALRAGLRAAKIDPAAVGLGADAEPEPEPPVEVDPTARERLLAAIAAGDPLVAMDLSRADLTGLDLSRRDLSRCLLDGARLVDVTLDGASLVGAVLSGADLTRASLVGADLTRADLTGARGEAVVLREATLSAAVMTRASLPRCDLRGCTMRRAEARDAALDGAELTGAVLDGSDLSGASLTGARARGASLAGTSLEGANAAGIDLTRADLTKVRASKGAVLTGAVLREAKAAQAIFVDAVLDGADLAFADLTRAVMTGAHMAHASLDGCMLRGAMAQRAVLQGARALRADAMELNLEGADLAGSDWRASSLYGAQLWKARVHGARFEGALLGATLLAPWAAALHASG